MKSICIISDSYYPEKTAAAKLINDLVIELCKKNLITLITVGKKNEIIRKKNIYIIRKKVPFIKSKNLYLKFIGELFMSFLLKKEYLKNIKFSYDLLICYSPSIFFTSLIQNIKMKKGSKKLVLIRDIFPDWLLDTGFFKKNSMIFKFLKNRQKQFYNCFDVLAVQSSYDKKYIKKIILKDKLLITIKNWIKLKKYIPTFNLKKTKSKFVFAGNIGLGQDLEFLIKFISVINLHFDRFKFYIIGDGRGNQILRQKLDNLNYKNYYFINKISQNKYEKYLSKFDVGIISLKKSIKYNNFPGKLLTYMSCNLPIIAFCSKKIELFNFINKNNIGIAIDTYKETVIKNKLKLVLKKKYNGEKILKKEFSIKKATNQILKLIN